MFYYILNCCCIYVQYTHALLLCGKKKKLLQIQSCVNKDLSETKKVYAALPANEGLFLEIQTFVRIQHIILLCMRHPRNDCK